MANQPNPGGRPAIQLNDEQLSMIYHYASKGISQNQIAHNIGVCIDTMVKLKKRDPRVKEALEKGKAHGITEVASALFEKATVDRDTTSMIFYLKNKDPENWEDVHKRQIYGDANKDAIETNTKFNVNFV